MSEGNNRKRFVAIDANSLVHRAYHAFPPNLATSEGLQVNAVYGFTSMFLKVLEELDPKYIVCAFDLKAPTVRHAQFGDYKAHRKPTDEELVNQFPLVKEILKAFNVPILEHKGYEADDVIGTLSEYTKSGQWSGENLEFIIVTGDKDLLQLVDDNIKVWLPQGNFKNVKMYAEAEVKERLGVGPEQVVDFKALTGDPSDNIPGVKGIGQKTAERLLNKYDSLEKIYQNLEELKPRVRELLVEGEESAELSRRLAQIIKDVDLMVQLEDCLMRDFKYKEILGKFQKFEFKSLVSRIPKSVDYEAGDQIGLFQKPNDVEDIRKISELEIKKGEESVGICFFDSKSVSLGVGEDYYWEGNISLSGFKTLIDEASKAKKIVFWGWQEFCRFAYESGIEEKYKKLLLDLSLSTLFDVSSGAYYLSTNQKDYSLKSLAFSNTEYVFPEEGIDSKPYARKAVQALFDIEKTLEEKYQDIASSSREFVQEVDIPLSLTTAQMFSKGILVDKDSLKKKSSELEGQIKKIEKRVYELVGHEFNIASNQQLSDILFNELNLPAEKKTKTGYSTSEDVLRNLSGAHPVIDEILKYREITKLKSTYLDPLVEYSEESEEGRVHSKFDQFGTTTGRLSSSDPNLQNIPTRSDLGKEIKSMFIAPKGRKLVSADYSQIELRVMAHISNDRNMLDDFENGRDFHSATAVRLLGLDKDSISKDDRRIAKTINFGVLYGMSPFGLSKALDIDRDKAQEYIEAYFDKYSGVKDYMDETLDFARKEGYVKTMWGRRRYVKGVKSGNWRIRSATEREAINMPIQGTAADIMRKAMVEVYKWIIGEKNVDLLLQIHDELVVECEEKEIDRVGKKLKEIMCGVADLKVPLEVEVTSGDNLQQ